MIERGKERKVRDGKIGRRGMVESERKVRKGCAEKDGRGGGEIVKE